MPPGVDGIPPGVGGDGVDGIPPGVDGGDGVDGIPPDDDGGDGMLGAEEGEDGDGGVGIPLGGDDDGELLGLGGMGTDCEELCCCVSQAARPAIRPQATTSRAREACLMMKFFIATTSRTLPIRPPCYFNSAASKLNTFPQHFRDI